MKNLYDKSIMRDRLNTDTPWLTMIFVVTFLVFLLSLFNSFVNWDDPVMLLENPYVQHLSWDNLRHIATSEFKGKYYPLTLLTFALECHFFKLFPFFYHVTNLLLHLLNVWLLYRIFKGLKFSSSAILIAVFLFAVHPLQVESVAWVSSRKDLLAMAFALLAWLQYDKGSKRSYWSAVLLFICSLLAKPLAITLPALLILVDHYRGRTILLTRYVPFGVIAAASAAVTIMMADIAQAFPATQLYGVSERFVFSTYAFVLYLFKFFVPVGLSCYYPLPEKINGLYPLEAYEAVIPVLLLASLFFLIKNKEFRLTMGWFIIGISPILHLIRINDSIIYERFAYWPFIGIFLGMGLVLEKALRDQRALYKILSRVLLAGWFVFLALTSWQRCFVWRDGITLWSDVIRQFSYLPVAYLNRGSAHYQMRWDNLALKDFEQVIKLDPQNSLAYFNRGIIFAERKEYGQAIIEYDKALYYDPANIKAYNNRGNVYSDLGQEQLAIDDYSRMLQMEPDNIFALLNRGIAYNKHGQPDLALADFQKALEIDPGNKFAAKMIIDIKKN